MSENCSGVEDCCSDVASALSITEKGRNKRKFISELSLDIPVKVSSLSLTEFPRYEIMDEIFQNACNKLGSLMGVSEDTVEEQDLEEFQQSDWDDPVACQLEELLSRNLFSTFRIAVNKIVEHGYTEEIAEWGVLHSSLFHGGMDVVLNVVNSALTFLKREKEFNAPKHPVFEDLQNLVNYTLLEMIYVLREVRPSMTVSEAMWCLLLNDLNLVTACVAERGTVGGSSSHEAHGESETLTQSYSETSGTSQSKDSNDSSKQIMPNEEGSQPKAPSAVHCNQSETIQCPCELGESCPLCQKAKEKFAAIVKEHIQNKSHAITGDEKSGCRGKCLSKRDVLRQKAFQLEKSSKGRMPKGGLKAKLAAWGNMMMDNSSRSPSSSSSVATKGAPTKLATSSGTNSFPVEGSNEPSSNSPASSVQDLVVASPAVNSKTHAASVTVANCSSKGEVNISDPPNAIDYYASIPFDETLQKHIPRDYKDEVILMLVPRKQDIEKELQGWTEWANEKVLRVTCRLGKDRSELKMLRQEKEEREKFKKEKQTLEESTMKRLSEMEFALTNATSQIEVAQCNIHRREEENEILKSDLEAAKVHAQRATSNLESALQSEQKTLKKLQSWDLEKRLVQQKLTYLKREIAALNNRLEKAKERQDQLMALLKQEEKEKLKVQTQIDSLRSEVEEETVVMEGEADKIRETAEKEMRKCQGEIKNLENVIAELKLKSNKSKIAALNVGYGSQLPKEGSKRLLVFEDNFGVKPERECVMCMTDEISVVFIPCSHQVLCSECNVLHEKEGMNDCPSCRTKIQMRITVRYRAN